MSNQLLEIKGLSVHVEGKGVLHRIDLEIRKGGAHVLVGPNGAGKSTLDYALMGNPHYEVMAGAIQFQGKEITREAPDKRIREGMSLSFQNPVEVPGLTLGTFTRNAMKQRRGARVRLWGFQRELEKAMELLQMDRAYGDRDLNAGFPGGEERKVEILQMLLLKPSLTILDETDSSLDVDAVRTVFQGVKRCQENRDGGLLIITHSTRILKSLQMDKTYIMADSRIIKTRDASLAERVNRVEFEQSLDEANQNSPCPERMEDSDGRKNICR